MSTVHQKSVFQPSQRDSKLFSMENSVSSSPSAFLSQISQSALKSTISNLNVNQATLVREYDAQIDDINKQIELQREKLMQKKSSNKQKYSAVPEEKQDDCPPQLKFIDSLFSDVFSKTQKVLDLMNCKEENFLFGRSVHSIQTEANSLNSKLKETGWTESFKKTLQDVGIKCQESSEFLEKVELEVKRINQRIDVSLKEVKGEKIEELVEPSENEEQAKQEEETIIKRINFLEDVFAGMDSNLDQIIDHFLKNGATLQTVHQKLNILNIEAVQNNYSSFQLQKQLSQIEDNSKIEGLINAFNEALQIRICEAKKTLNKKLLSDYENKIKNQNSKQRQSAKTFQGVELNLEDSDSGDDNDVFLGDKLFNPLIDHHLLSYSVSNSSQKSQQIEKLIEERKANVVLDLEKMSSKSESCGDDYGTLSFLSNKSNHFKNIKGSQQVNLHNLKYRQNMFEQLIQRRRQQSKQDLRNPIIPVVQLVHATIDTTTNPIVKDRVVFQPSSSNNSLGGSMNPKEGNNSQQFSKSTGTPISNSFAPLKTPEQSTPREGIPKSESIQQASKQPSIPVNTMFNTITPPASNKDKQTTENPSISLDQPKEIQKDKTLPAKTNSSQKLLGQLTSQAQSLAENAKKDPLTQPASLLSNNTAISQVQSQEQQKQPEKVQNKSSTKPPETLQQQPQQTPQNTQAGPTQPQSNPTAEKQSKQPPPEKTPSGLSSIFQNTAAQSINLGRQSINFFEQQKQSQQAPVQGSKSEDLSKAPKEGGLFGLSNPILKVENKNEEADKVPKQGGLFGQNPVQQDENKTESAKENVLSGLFAQKQNKPDGPAVSLPQQQDNNKSSNIAGKQPLFSAPPKAENSSNQPFGSLFQQSTGQSTIFKPAPPSEANIENQQKPLAPEGAQKEQKQQQGLFSQSQPLPGGGLFQFKGQQPKNDQEDDQGQFSEPTSMKKKTKPKEPSAQMEGLMGNLNDLSFNNAQESKSSNTTAQQSTPLFKPIEATPSQAPGIPVVSKQTSNFLGGVGFGQSVILPQPSSTSTGLTNQNNNSLFPGLSNQNNSSAQNGGLFGNNNTNNNTGMAGLFNNPPQQGSNMFGFTQPDQSNKQQQQPALGIHNMDGQKLKAFAQPAQALNNQQNSGLGMFGNPPQQFGMGQSGFGTGQGQFGSSSFGGNNNNSTPFPNQAFKTDLSKMSFFSSQPNPQQPQQQQQQQQGMNGNNMFQGFMGQKTEGLFGGGMNMNTPATSIPSAQNGQTSMFKPRK